MAFGTVRTEAVPMPSLKGGHVNCLITRSLDCHEDAHARRLRVARYGDLIANYLCMFIRRRTRSLACHGHEHASQHRTARYGDLIANNLVLFDAVQGHSLAIGM